MAGFTFTLELEDGTPAHPPVLRTAVPTWSAGDTIPLLSQSRKADRPQAESAMSRTISMPGAGLEPARPQGDT